MGFDPSLSSELKVVLPSSLVNHTQLEVKDDMSGAVTGLAMAQLFWLE